jgi:hypothetical protein
MHSSHFTSELIIAGRVSKTNNEDVKKNDIGSKNCPVDVYPTSVPLDSIPLINSAIIAKEDR